MSAYSSANAKSNTLLKVFGPASAILRGGNGSANMSADGAHRKRSRGGAMQPAETRRDSAEEKTSYLSAKDEAAKRNGVENVKHVNAAADISAVGWCNAYTNRGR
jgi:hypothetical protein